MRNLINSKKRLAGLVAVMVVAAVAALGAYAYFTSSGNGSGTANAGSNDTAIVLHASFDAGLVPGTSADVSFTADNTSTTTTGHVSTISFVSVTSSDTGCQTYLTGNQADFSMDTVTEDTSVAKTPNGDGTPMPHNATLKWLNNADVDQTPCADQPLQLNVATP